MKKSSLFISTILTTFIVAVLAGTASAYRAFEANTAQAQQPTPVAVATPVQLTPEQAAQLAANYWGRSDLYSVESSVLNGASAYKVTFSSGDIVYVSPDGQIMAAIAAPVAVPQNNTLSFQPAQQPAQPATTFSGGEHEHDGGGDD
jgi:hypothetical protein